MSHSAHARTQARRSALAWLSLIAFVITSIGLGSILALPVVPRLLGIEPDGYLVGWEPLWLGVSACLLLGFAVYVGAIAWLLFAKLFFSKEEVSAVIFCGPSTRLDRWLVDTLFRSRR